MIDYPTLAQKRLVNRIGPSGVEENQIDMLTHVITNVNVHMQDLVVVNEHYVARPDLISLAVYGTDKFGDIICKYNGISNPFELNEGDILYIPVYSEIKYMFGNEIQASELISDPKATDIVEKEFKFQKEKNERRTPSEQVVGERNYVIDKSMGVVFY